MPASASHVLVVEDSDDDHDTVLDGARRAGVQYQIRRATSGDDCLAHLHAADGTGVLPVLVLLDLNTPSGDGREALSDLKRDPKLRGVPVVVLSTSTNPGDVEFCYRHGANAYHVKPVSHPEHLALIEEIFGYWLRCTVLPGLDRPWRP